MTRPMPELCDASVLSTPEKVVLSIRSESDDRATLHVERPLRSKRLSKAEHGPPKRNHERARLHRGASSRKRGKQNRHGQMKNSEARERCGTRARRRPRLQG